LAGRDPAAILLDSDLDWGQDLFALRREARARGVDALRIAYFGIAQLCRHGLPKLEPLVPGRRATGWIAISEEFYRERGFRQVLRDPCDMTTRYARDEIPPHPYAWLRAYQPVTIAGRSIRLYYVPPGH
jgi:hypothetical protein